MPATAIYPDLRWRRFGCRGQSAGAACRCVYAVGRTAERHGRVHGSRACEAAAQGRRPTFSLSTRPILGDTEERAWDRARAILDRVVANRGGAPAPQRQNVGSKRLLAAAAEAEVHDTCLWTALAAATGAQGNSTALVGTLRRSPRRCSSITSSAPPAC